jgi:hypothetical protein
MNHKNLRSITQRTTEVHRGNTKHLKQLKRQSAPYNSASSDQHSNKNEWWDVKSEEGK